ncbi:hypothetical protein CROQUDRAFT_672579 [Cronartium quercuum f. sp. fusiforme G11]|uniref:Uncharacterized protein n=1 Tax=Cronartium quercuum f. sp. fusiforme G11 TaxID=708437 RepID=A0A9P6T9X5_9BASI|nr:hypothetical protein CROQUDRAFT_672579 [Cronartium quercuum f. sp. fusiforme G11]
MSSPSTTSNEHPTETQNEHVEISSTHTSDNSSTKDVSKVGQEGMGNELSMNTSDKPRSSNSPSRFDPTSISETWLARVKTDVDRCQGGIMETRDVSLQVENWMVAAMGEWFKAEGEHLRDRLMEIEILEKGLDDMYRELDDAVDEMKKIGRFISQEEVSNSA